jgi:hypothetical protein
VCAVELCKTESLRFQNAYPLRKQGLGCYKFRGFRPWLRENSSPTYASPPTSKARAGWGIEAQREAVVRYLNGGRWTLSAEYVETESGRRNDRPKLAAALSHAKAIGAKLVFAKLDRDPGFQPFARLAVGNDE